jgi:membrane-associated phospholipid phosphatase
MRPRWLLPICLVLLLGVHPCAAQTRNQAPEPIASLTEQSGEPETEHEAPFSRLLPHLGTDLRQFVTADAALVLGLGGAAALAALPFDDSINERATEGGPSTFFDTGASFGSTYVQVGGALATYLVGTMASTPRVRHVGADLIRAQVLSGLLTQGLKFSVRRQRPYVREGETSGSYAFPSGHTSSSWTSATVLWRHFGWKAGEPASVVAAWVAAARVQQDQHFLSDVAFGAALGIASGRVVTIGHGPRAVSVRPAPVPGGAALLFRVGPVPSPVP